MLVMPTSFGSSSMAPPACFRVTATFPPATQFGGSVIAIALKQQLVSQAAPDLWSLKNSAGTAPPNLATGAPGDVTFGKGNRRDHARGPHRQRQFSRARRGSLISGEWVDPGRFTAFGRAATQPVGSRHSSAGSGGSALSVA